MLLNGLSHYPKSRNSVSIREITATLITCRLEREGGCTFAIHVNQIFNYLACDKHERIHITVLLKLQLFQSRRRCAHNNCPLETKCVGKTILKTLVSLCVQSDNTTVLLRRRVSTHRCSRGSGYPSEHPHTLRRASDTDGWSQGRHYWDRSASIASGRMMQPLKSKGLYGESSLRTGMVS